MVGREDSLPVARTGGQRYGKWLGLPFLVTVAVTFVYVLTPTRPLEDVYGGVHMRAAAYPPAIHPPDVHLQCGDLSAVNVSAATTVETDVPPDLDDFLRLMAPLPIFSIDAALIKCILAGDNCTRLDSTHLFRFAVDSINWSCAENYLTRLVQKEENGGWSVNASADNSNDALHLMKNDRRFLISRMQLPNDSDYAIFPDAGQSVAVPRFVLQLFSPEFVRT
uniref:Uncharacterized protein n=1 Tax=Plectus sambesii TaxID=2011161 RepID=A0A914W873_9BILA